MWTQVIDEHSSSGCLRQLDGTFLYMDEKISPNSEEIKIAGFDLDWTITRPVKGKFPKNPDDWAVLPNRLETIKKYREVGYIVVIFTNQSSANKNKLMFNYEKVSKIVGYLNRDENIIDMVLMATKKDIYRKPEIGMWGIVEQVFKAFKINKGESFYCGDAAGRPQDFAASDLEFANNMGVAFKTPEEIFPTNNIDMFEENQKDNQKMYIFVGMPGSGKTTFYKTFLESKGYVHANQDELKTKKKLLTAIETAMKEGKSVAVDATNPTKDKRGEYIRLAAKYSVKTIILYFVRDGHGFNKLREKPVPTIAYSMYYKYLVEPSMETDGVNVIEIN